MLSELLVAEALAASADAAPAPMNYANTTVNGYLALKDALDEAMVLGDQGFYITPIFGEDGEVLTYTVRTWTVTNQSGIFTPIVTNPRPWLCLGLAHCAYSAADARLGEFNKAETVSDMPPVENLIGPPMRRV